jgi:hypothetical protein
MNENYEGALAKALQGNWPGNDGEAWQVCEWASTRPRGPALPAMGAGAARAFPKYIKGTVLGTCAVWIAMRAVSHLSSLGTVIPTTQRGANAARAKYLAPFKRCITTIQTASSESTTGRTCWRRSTRCMPSVPDCLATTYVDIPMKAALHLLQETLPAAAGIFMTELHQGQPDTFTRIAENVGCDDKTVRTLGAEYMAELEASHRPEMPDWLGIDETQIDGKMRCVLTDIGERRILDMLPDRDKATLAGWLHRFKDRHWVKGVAIDMWRPYRDVSHHDVPSPANR